MLKKQIAKLCIDMDLAPKKPKKKSVSESTARADKKSKNRSQSAHTPIKPEKKKR